MQYISTRGDAPSLSFSDVVLTGLANDGGLYVPESIPVVSKDTMRAWAGLTYPELMFEVIQPFVAQDVSDEDLKAIIHRSYQNFRHEAIAPLVQTQSNEWVLELFQGPTLAFKDFALQFLGQLVDHLLKQRGERAVVLGATSGDTGSAAIEGCRHCTNLDIFILHPHERVSDVQRRQMTTVNSGNVHNVAIRGNFDDCQKLVKASFSDQSFLPNGLSLMAVNSINWARIMAQIVYYFYAALRLGAPERAVAFSVPTGNFGDIYAGYIASKMGLPIEQLVIATNQNDILHRCISRNDMSQQTLHHTLSPSMDIMVSSNFERLLYDLYGRKSGEIKRLMNEFESGAMQLSESALSTARELFSSYRLDDLQMLDVVRSVFKSTDYLLDPHSAIGVAAARATRRCHTTPMVCLATAHPAKFPDAIAQALPNQQFELPNGLQHVFDAEEFYTVLDNQAEQVHQFIRSNLG